VGLSTFRRQNHYTEPEILNGLYSLEEIIKPYGFYNMAIGVQIVGLYDVLVCAGRSEHDNRNGSEFNIPVLATWVIRPDL